MQPKHIPGVETMCIISKLCNDIDISNRNNTLMISRIIKEVLLVKADGVKFQPNLKGRSKTGRKSIIDMDSQEAQIIADVVELGINTLTAWSQSTIAGKSRSFQWYAFLLLEPVFLN